MFEKEILQLMCHAPHTAQRVYMQLVIAFKSKRLRNRKRNNQASSKNSMLLPNCNERGYRHPRDLLISHESDTLLSPYERRASCRLPGITG